MKITIDQDWSAITSVATETMSLDLLVEQLEQVGHEVIAVRIYLKPVKEEENDVQNIKS